MGAGIANPPTLCQSLPGEGCAGRGLAPAPTCGIPGSAGRAGPPAVSEPRAPTWPGNTARPHAGPRGHRSLERRRQRDPPGRERRRLLRVPIQSRGRPPARSAEMAPLRVRKWPAARPRPPPAPPGPGHSRQGAPDGARRSRPRPAALLLRSERGSPPHPGRPRAPARPGRSPGRAPAAGPGSGHSLRRAPSNAAAATSASAAAARHVTPGAAPRAPARPRRPEAALPRPPRRASRAPRPRPGEETEAPGVGRGGGRAARGPWRARARTRRRPRSVSAAPPASRCWARSKEPARHLDSGVRAGVRRRGCAGVRPPPATGAKPPQYAQPQFPHLSGGSEQRCPPKFVGRKVEWGTDFQ